MMPIIKCPKCNHEEVLGIHVITAQSNQNIIYKCPNCYFEKRNIETSKG